MVQLGVRRAVYYITVAYAQLEKGILVERVKTGMARAKMQSRRLGRPRAVDGEWAQVRLLIERGRMSQRKTAEVLGVSKNTVSRLLAPNGGENGTSLSHV
jgi:DNA invertase Pin-like site-specific DNA recombinase